MNLNRFLIYSTDIVVAIIFHAGTVFVGTVVPACTGCTSTFAFIVSIHAVNFANSGFWLG